MRLLTVLLLFGSSSTVAAQDVPRVTADSALMKLAALVVGRAHEVDAIWPGFWKSPRFALHRGVGEALIYTDGRPFAGAVRASDRQLPESLRRHAYTIRTAQLPAEFPVIRGDPTPYILDLANISVSPVAFLVHESFHSWQHSHYDVPLFEHCIPPTLPTNIAEPGKFSAGLARELEQLVGAISAVDGAARLHASRNYLRLRRQRMINAPVTVSYTEQRQERSEGTAELVGRHAELVLSTGNVKALRDSIVASLQRLTPLLEQNVRANTVPGRRTLQGNYWYSTGAAIAYLLDELRVRDWRARVVAGAHLDALLADHVADEPYLAWLKARPAIRTLCR